MSPGTSRLEWGRDNTCNYRGTRIKYSRMLRKAVQKILVGTYDSDSFDVPEFGWPGRGQHPVACYGRPVLPDCAALKGKNLQREYGTTASSSTVTTVGARQCKSWKT
eukprot:1172612-Rhodomonas_salina.2